MNREISLVMMVKDEERNLPRLLDSVAGTYDEFIAVDTGSKDSTPRILESYGARIIHSPWRKDFSYHRNEGIRAATKEWLMLLDADEAVDVNSRPLIRSYVAQAKDIYHAIWFQVRSFTKENIYSQASSIRMIRNGKGYHFQNRIHNQLQYDDAPTVMTPIVLWHWGYMLSKEERLKKHEYRLEILKQDLEDHPDDAGVHHHAAVSYRAAMRYDLAIEVAKRAISLAKESPEKWPIEKFTWTYFIGASCAYLLDRKEEALELCYDGLEHIPTSLDLHYMIARISYGCGDYEKTLKHGRLYLRLREETINSPNKHHHQSDTLTLNRDVFSQVQDAYMRLGGFNGVLERINNA